MSLELLAPKAPEIWIGKIEIRPFGDSVLLADVDGAFVNVLTWAVDVKEFRRKAGELMDYLHLKIMAIDNAEPLKNRGDECDLDDEIRRIASEVRYNPSAVMYSTFHTWGDPVQ